MRDDDEDPVAVERATRSWFLEHDFLQVGEREITDSKPKAIIYLDDRTVRCEGPGTVPTIEEIRDLAVPWSEKS